MKYSRINFISMSPLFFLFILVSSCSKDSDLLTDYVLADSTDSKELGLIAVNDSYFSVPNSSTVLDVLANDNIENGQEVEIVKTSNPINGIVVINSNKTLTYIPADAPETTTTAAPDTFTYTTQVTDNGNATTQQATVTVNTATPTSGENVYYVTTSGKGTNTGKSEAESWSIAHAFANAVAGDIVYVKAGNYDSPILTTVRNGTAASPIKFIGYKNTPGDIISVNRPTYTKAMFDADNTVLDGVDMPLFNNDRGSDLNPDSTDWAIRISHNYIHIENIKSQYYRYGIISNNNCIGLTIKNFISNENGDWDPNGAGYDLPYSTSNLTGQGIYLLNVSDSFVYNCSVFNAGAAAYFTSNVNNVLIDGCEAYSTKTGNASDYLFDLAGFVNSTLRNYYAYREDLDTSKMHLSRAVMLQLYSSGSVIENGTHVNTRTQVSTFSDNNILRNINVIGNGKANQGNIQVSGESDNNVFYNWTIDGTEGIQFVGEADSRSPGNNPAFSGNDNYFINFKITNVPAGTGNAVFSFHRLSFSQKDPGGTNYVVNMTADKSVALVNTNTTGTLNIYNSTFSNVTNYDTFSTSGGATDALVQLNFTNCNFYNNGFSTPTDDAERTLINTKALNPLFNADYTLQSGSPLIGAGMDVSGIHSEAAKDILGNIRSSYDIGAYEY
ncbi:hypothetical protein [uncultured Maribacter sp.]|uniref:Ig-like domain-containing protein n=1 Tax=uncultured Maribacter sp. TaxID=431308 RepID=UPI0026366927|nr:hypothetical protein [uncultured Maribacter sp.]